MKITLIGAGSSGFAAELIKDFLLIPGLENCTLGLIDIDECRLETTCRIAGLLLEKTGKKWKIESGTDRTEILGGSDFIVNTIEVAGPQNIGREYEIPLKYGVDQCIGDTIGPGGLFKALRTLPAWMDILTDIERYAPGALVMNYTNPMSLTVLCTLRVSSVRVIGLCHSIQNTSRQIAGYLDLSYESLLWKAGGTNHLSWFTELKDGGKTDLYPLLRKKGAVPEIRSKDPVRFELMDHLGAFMTESSGHVSEYLPYIRKRKDIIAEVCGPGELGESGYYLKVWPEERKEGEKMLRSLETEEVTLERGNEYASYIVEAVYTNRPNMIYGNVSNSGNHISNLSRDGVVEVACIVDAKGIQPVFFGELPEHLAALNRQHMAFHDLVVQSVVYRDKDAAEYALKIDPLTSAVCSLKEIRAMFEELLEAEKKYLPEYLYTKKGETV